MSWGVVRAQRREASMQRSSAKRQAFSWGRGQLAQCKGPQQAIKAWDPLAPTWDSSAGRREAETLQGLTRFFK